MLSMVVNPYIVIIYYTVALLTQSSSLGARIAAAALHAVAKWVQFALLHFFAMHCETLANALNNMYAKSIKLLYRSTYQVQKAASLKGH